MVILMLEKLTRVTTALIIALGMSGPYLPQANATTMIRICTNDSVIYIPFPADEEQPISSTHHACHVACLNDKQKVKVKQPAG